MDIVIIKYFFYFLKSKKIMVIPNPSYSVGVVVVFGLFFLFSLQQCCISSITDHPSITYRYWICLYCLNGFILEIIIYLHFVNPTNTGLLAAYRVQLLISTIVVLAIAYKFITSIINGVYASQTNRLNKVCMYCIIYNI